MQVKDVPAVLVASIRTRASLATVGKEIREQREPPTGIEVRVLEGGTVASTIQRGRYDHVGCAYEALTAWIPTHGRDGGPPREFYLNDPYLAGEEAALTEVPFPLR